MNENIKPSMWLTLKRYEKDNETEGLDIPEPMMESLKYAARDWARDIYAFDEVRRCDPDREPNWLMAIHDSLDFTSSNPYENWKYTFVIPMVVYDKRNIGSISHRGKIIDWVYSTKKFREIIPYPESAVRKIMDEYIIKELAALKSNMMQQAALKQSANSAFGVFLGKGMPANQMRMAVTKNRYGLYTSSKQTSDALFSHPLIIESFISEVERLIENLRRITSSSLMGEYGIDLSEARIDRGVLFVENKNYAVISQPVWVRVDTDCWKFCDPIVAQPYQPDYYIHVYESDPAALYDELIKITSSFTKDSVLPSMSLFAGLNVNRAGLNVDILQKYNEVFLVENLEDGYRTAKKEYMEYMAQMKDKYEHIQAKMTSDFSSLYPTPLDSLKNMKALLDNKGLAQKRVDVDQDVLEELKLFSWK